MQIIGKKTLIFHDLAYHKDVDLTSVIRDIEEGDRIEIGTDDRNPLLLQVSL